MPADSPAQATLENGPSGFIDINGNLLVVDHGKIFHNEAPVGFLFEDGLIRGTAPPFTKFKGLKVIEEIPGCSFKGIDARGVVLELPGPPGPTGLLKYNGVPLPVLNGRIASQDHRLLGSFDDNGKVCLRDHKTPSLLHELDEYTQLSTVFQGLNSQAQPFFHEWIRPLHRLDRSYMDNEIIRYFEDYDKLTTPQKRYVLETMNFWARAGILQIVRRSEGDAALGNVKHGASGVTGVRTGKVTLDREEFGVEIDLYNRFGAVVRLPTRIKPLFEVRINLVVSHEFGHQLEFTMSQACMDKVDDMYRVMLKRCDGIHPLPPEYEGFSELVELQQIEKRVFISGYSRVSFHEYWAECVAAFSVKPSRDLLKAMDPDVYAILKDVVFSPEKMLSPKLEQEALRLQTSLRVGGELSDDLLDK